MNSQGLPLNVYGLAFRSIYVLVCGAAEAAAIVQTAEHSGIDIPCLPRRCVLCPRTGGALIRTTEGKQAMPSRC